MTSEKRPFIPYGRQSIDPSDIEAVANALQSPIITRGAYVEAFEQAIADYCGAAFAVAFNSGSTALIAACHVVETTSNDTIISTPNTFAASVNAATRHGARPILIDIDRDTGNLDLNLLEDFLKKGKRTRGKNIIIPVHFSGLPVDMQKLERMIDSPDTVVIEDAAHALGSKYSDGQMVGCCAWSDMTILSFHPVKTITTGEGGMVLTNNPELYHRLKRFRNNGIEREPEFLEAETKERFQGYYEVKESTNNYNFTEFQAALGLSQLKRIDLFIQKRQQLMALYRKLLKEIPHLKMMTDTMDNRTAFHLCAVQIDFTAYNTTRSLFIDELANCGIGTQVHYIPIYRHPFFKARYGDTSENYPETEKYYSEALSLPLYYELTEDDVEFIVETLEKLLAECARKKELLSKDSLALKKQHPKHLRSRHR